MAQIETWLKCDLKNPVKVQYLHGNLFSQDNQANLIGVELYDNGAEVTASGTVTANIIREDGATVTATGSTSGNKASVVLPATAYAIPGAIAIIIKITLSGVITTIAAVGGTVYRSSTDTPVDPGTIMPSIQTLISQIQTAVASIPADYSSLWTSLAPAFSASTDYAAGQYVTNNGKVYRFNTAHTAGAWVASEVTEVKLGNEISDLNSAIGDYKVIKANRSSGIGQYWNVILQGLAITSGKKIRTKLVSYGGTHLTRVNLLAFNGATNLGKIGELTEVDKEIEITAAETFDTLYYQFFTTQDEGAISAEIVYFDDVLPYSIGENINIIDGKAESNKSEILIIEKGYGHVADPVISQNISFTSNSTKNTGIPLKAERRYTVFSNAPTDAKITYIGSIGQSGYVGNVAYTFPVCSFITTGEGSFGFSISGASGSSFEYRFDVYDTTDNATLKTFIEQNGFNAKYNVPDSPIINGIKQINGGYITPLFNEEITFSQGAVKYTGFKTANATRYTVVTDAPVGTFTSVANYSNGWAGKTTPTSQAATFTTEAAGELVFATQGGHGTFTVMVFDTTGNDALVAFLEMYGIKATEYLFDSKTINQTTEVPKTTVIFTGDSQTQRFTWGTKFKELFGANNDEAVDCYGYGGENSTQVACTQGGLPLYVEPFTIPAETTAVEIHLFTPDYDGDLDLLKQNTIGYVGISIDGVVGNITWSSSKQYFTRTEAGSEKTITRPVKVNSTLSTRINSRLVIELGTNNPIDSVDKMEKLFNEIDCMIRHNGNDAYIVLGLTWRGHAQNIEEVNRMMASRFGQHFLDIRTYLIQYGLEDAGITPTAADEAAIANNNVPPSLLDDEIHFNAACGNVIGQQIYNHGKDLGLWD